MYLLNLVGFLFPHIIDDARSKPHHYLEVLQPEMFKTSYFLAKILHDHSYIN